jgi:hypothetical protein
MENLNDAHHIFRHIKKSWTEGDFIDPAAFQLRTKENETGLSVNWVEYFGRQEPAEAIEPLKAILVTERKIGGSSKFALLNVGAAKRAAAKYVTVEILTDDKPGDPSHTVIEGYVAYNEQVAEELAKIVITAYPATADVHT